VSDLDEVSSDDAEPTLEVALDAWAQARTAEVLVCRSAEIASVGSDGSVSVRMLTPIQEVVAGIVRWVEAPLLPRIPVASLAIGDFILTSKPKIGQRGLVLIRDVSHEEVDSGQGSAPVVTPQDPRRWDGADAVFLPFALTDSTWSPANVPSTGAAFVLSSGTALRVGSATAARAVALADDTAQRVRRIESYLNTATFTVAGAVTLAPTPVPFTGSTEAAPACIASVVLTPVVGTATSSIASDRLLTDG